MDLPKKSVGYFVNWGIYDRQYHPHMIPHRYLTHINYAFANVNKLSGEVTLSDPWADVEVHYANDRTEGGNNNLYGCLKQLYLLKCANRNLKVFLSIGGWSFSLNFENIGDPSWRNNFVRSAMRLLEDVGLDGLDIDYEYPKTAEDAKGYLELLRELRFAIAGWTEVKRRPKGQYQISVAAPCGVHHMSTLLIREMDPLIDFWNLMAYDFSGSWDRVAGHQANLYSDNPNGQSVDRAVRTYIAKGVHPSKLVIGMPLYGRSFTGTKGPGTPFSGVGKGSWEEGLWDYKALPRPGADVFHDHRLGLSYSYDPSKKEMISFDTLMISVQKAQYINERRLGGVMWWELDADKPDESGGSMIRAAWKKIGPQLEYKENELHYPGSKYENLRNGMR